MRNAVARILQRQRTIERRKLFGKYRLVTLTGKSTIVYY
jgi:hypothetical protein